MHFGTEQEMEQGTATGDIAAGDLPPVTSSVPVLILPTPDAMVLLLAIQLLMVLPFLLLSFNVT